MANIEKNFFAELGIYIWETLKNHYNRRKKFWNRFFKITLALFFAVVLLDRVVMPIIVKHAWDMKVPEVVGLTVEEAQAKLKKADLGLKIVSQIYDPNQPQGIILSQMPEPRSTVKRDRAVRVQISKEADMTYVPELNGVSLRQAEISLADWGLSIGELAWQFSDTLPENFVVASLPEVGTRIPYGTPINLIVNKSPSADSVDVPYVVGKYMEEGVKILTEAGLKVREIKMKKEEDKIPGVIQKQSLEPDTRVPRETEITIEVSKSD